MDRRQKTIVLKFLSVITITLVAVVGMVNFKDWVNRSEAMRAMDQLGRAILTYRKDTGAVPPESEVNRVIKEISGGVRLVNLQYRALWIDPDAAPGEILAYVKKNYHSSLLSDGYVVLFLDGGVKWLETDEFEKLLASQQSQSEIEMLRQKEAMRGQR